MYFNSSKDTLEIVSKIIDKLNSQKSRLLKDFHFREIALGGASALLVKVMAVALTMLFNIVLTRSLGASDTGKYFLAFSVMSIGGIIAKQGIDRSVLRFLSPAFATNQWKEVKLLLTYSVRKVIVGSVLSTLVVVVFADFISQFIFQRSDLGSLIRIFAIVIVPLSFSYYMTEAFKAMKKVIVSVSIRGVLIPILSILGILLLVPKIGILGAIVSSIVAYWFVFVFSATSLHRKVIKSEDTYEGGTSFSFSKEEFKKSSKPLWLTSLTQEIITWSPAFIIGFYLVDAEVGKYEIVKRVGLSTSFFLFAFNTILSPKIGEMFAKADLKSIGKICRQTTGLMAIMTAPIFFGLFFFSEEILYLFGKGFVDGTILPLQILLIGQFIHVLFGPTGNILLMCGYEKYLFYSALIGVALLLGLNLLLVPDYGILGAAIAHATTWTIRNLYVAYYVKKHLNLITLPILNTLIR